MNSSFDELERGVRIALPDVRIERARMSVAALADAIDIRRDGRLVNVLWTLDDGFCVTEVRDTTAFDDTPEFVVASVEEVLQVLTFLFGVAELRDVDGIDDPARIAA
jgi:hypothetical protein